MIDTKELDALSSELREDFRRIYGELGRQIADERLESLARWNAKTILERDELNRLAGV